MPSSFGRGRPAIKCPPRESTALTFMVHIEEDVHVYQERDSRCAFASYQESVITGAFVYAEGVSYCSSQIMVARII